MTGLGTDALVVTRNATLAVVPTLTTLRNAVQMLSSRTQILLQYVQGVVDGTMKRDEQVLRMIAGLMAGLPIEDSPEFRNEFATVRPLGSLLPPPLQLRLLSPSCVLVVLRRK